MGRGYDGEIRIDSRVDTTGVNSGVTKVGGALRGIGSTMKSVVKGLLVGFMAVLAVVAAVVSVVTSLVKSLFVVGKVTGEAAKESLKYAKKVDELKQTFAELKTAVSDAFRPLIIAAMPWINAVAGALTRMLGMMAQVMAALTGQTGYWKAVVAGADAAGDAAETAEKKAKGALAGLAGFDEIDVLEQPNEATGTGGGTGVDMEWIPITEEAISWSEKLLEIWSRIKEFFAPIGDALGELGKAFGELWNALGPVWDIIWEYLKPAFEWFQKGAVVIIEWLTEKIKQLTEAIQKNPGAWATVLTVLGVILLVILAMNSPIVAMGLAIFVLVAAVGWLSENWDSVGKALENAWKWFKSFIGTGIELLGEMFPAVKKFIQETINIIKNWDDVKQKIDEVVRWVKEAIGNLPEWFQTKLIDPIVSFFKRAWEKISSTFTDTITRIKTTATSWSDWFKTQVIEKLVTWFKDGTSKIFTFFSGTWDSIKQVWLGAWSWFQNTIINPLVNAFKIAVDGISNFFTGLWSGIKNGVKSAINSAIGTLNRFISGVIGGINNLIAVWNNLGLPGWLQIPYITVPQIPYLAQGAVIPPNAQFLAMVGDQRSGRNLEAPESLIRQIVREETANLGSGQDVTIRFAGSLGALVRELKPYIDTENKRVGRSLLKGVA